MSAKKNEFDQKDTENSKMPFEMQNASSKQFPPYPDEWLASTHTPRFSPPRFSSPDEWVPISARNSCLLKGAPPLCCQSTQESSLFLSAKKFFPSQGATQEEFANFPPLLPDGTSSLSPSSQRRTPSIASLEPVPLQTAARKPATRSVNATQLQQQVESYLQSHPNVRHAMVWGFGKSAWEMPDRWGDPLYWKSYEKWDSVSKIQFHQAIYAFASGQDPFFLNPFEDLTYEKCHFVYIHFVAHALWTEISQFFSWRLHNYPTEQLYWLLHATSLIIFSRRYAIGCQRIWDQEELQRAKEYFFNFEELHPDAQIYQTPKKLSFQLESLLQPISPRKMFTFVKDLIGVESSDTEKDSIRKMVTWSQWNISHGGNVLFFKKPQFDMISSFPAYLTFNYPISSQDVAYSLQHLFFDYESNVQGIQRIDPRWVTSLGKVASYKQGNSVFFEKHSAYYGCQVSGSMYHFLLRSMNIPSLYQLVSIANATRTDLSAPLTHRGLKVYFEKDLRFLIHNDDIYEGNMSVGLSDGRRYNLSLLRPTDPDKIFVPESFYHLWFPFNEKNVHLISGSNVSLPLQRHAAVQEKLYYNYITYWGAMLQCDEHVLQWWAERESVVEEKDMNLQNVPWIFYYKETPVPAGFDKTKGLDDAVQRVRERVQELRLKGYSFQSYLQNFIAWKDQRLLSRALGAITL